MYYEVLYEVVYEVFILFDYKFELFQVLFL